MDINHVSNSMLGLWQRCEIAWSLRYLPPRLKIPPGVAAHRGGSMHYAIEINNKAKIDSGQDEPEDVLTDACRDEFYRRCKDGVSIPKEDRAQKNSILNNAQNRAIEHTKIFHREIAPKIVPSIVEKKIWGDFGLDLPLMGILDVMDIENIIHDFKSTDRKKPKGWERTELQPSFYTLLIEQELKIKPQFKYHIIKDSDDERDSTRGETECQALINRIKIFIASIKTGIFKPAEPGHWCCSEKWCGYWPMCEFAQ